VARLSFRSSPSIITVPYGHFVSESRSGTPRSGNPIHDHACFECLYCEFVSFYHTSRLPLDIYLYIYMYLLEQIDPTPTRRLMTECKTYIYIFICIYWSKLIRRLRGDSCILDVYLIRQTTAKFCNLLNCAPTVLDQFWGYAPLTS
jgi:hypothetical protein